MAVGFVWVENQQFRGCWKWEERLKNEKKNLVYNKTSYFQSYFQVVVKEKPWIVSKIHW